jgi:hypothetical protein
MSSNVQYKDSVCIFDGKNWLAWEQDIMSYALLNKFANVFNKTLKPKDPADPTAPTDNKHADLKAWHQMDQQAQGLVRSMVTGDICAKLLTEYPVYKSGTIATVTMSSTTTPVHAISSVSRCTAALSLGTPGSTVTPTTASMFAYLAATYGAPGINQIFANFGAMACVSIPENTNPTPSLDKIARHYQQLAVNGLPLPNAVQALSMIHALPPSFDRLAMYLVSKKLVSNINTLNVCNIITCMFKARNAAHNCAGSSCSSSTTAKVSGLHRAPGEALSFHSQQSGPSGSGNHYANHSNSSCGGSCSHGECRGCGGCRGRGGRGNKRGCSNGRGNKRNRSQSQAQSKGKGKASAHAAIEDSNNEYAAHVEEVTPNSPPTTCASDAPPPVARYIGGNVTNLHPDSAELGFRYGLAPGSLEHCALDRLLHSGHVDCFERLKANDDAARNTRDHGLRMHGLPMPRTPHKRTLLLARLDGDPANPLAERIAPAAAGSLPPTQRRKRVCKCGNKGKLDLNNNADAGSTPAPEASGSTAPTHCVAGVHQDNLLCRSCSCSPTPKCIHTLSPTDSSTPRHSSPPPIWSERRPAWALAYSNSGSDNNEVEYHWLQPARDHVRGRVCRGRLRTPSATFETYLIQANWNT